MDYRTDIIKIHVRFFPQRFERFRLNMLYLRKRHRCLVRQISLRLSMPSFHRPVIRNDGLLATWRYPPGFFRRFRSHAPPYFRGRTLIIPQTVSAESRPCRYRLERDTDRNTACGAGSWKHFPLDCHWLLRGFAFRCRKYFRPPVGHRLRNHRLFSRKRAFPDTFISDYPCLRH